MVPGSCPFAPRILYRTVYTKAAVVSFWTRLPCMLHSSLQIRHRELPSHVAMAETRRNRAITKPQANIHLVKGLHNTNHRVTMRPFSPEEEPARTLISASNSISISCMQQATCSEAEVTTSISQFLRQKITSNIHFCSGLPALDLADTERNEKDTEVLEEYFSPPDCCYIRDGA